VRTLFTLFGGLAIAGAIMDAALLALLGLAIMESFAGPGAGVGDFLRSHVSAPPWPANALGQDWLPPLALAFPALLYFLVRIILGLMTGAASLMAARQRRRR
jgi:hypothetical protein